MKFRAWLKTGTALLSGAVWTWLPLEKGEQINVMDAAGQHIQTWLARWCYPWGVVRPLNAWPLWERVA